MLTLDEVIDNAALNGAGPIQGVESAKIFHSLGLVTDQNVPHAARFELEDAARETIREDLVRFRIIQRQILDDNFDPAEFANNFQGVDDDGESCQTQEIHFEKIELLQASHVVLGNNFVLVCLVKGDELFKGLGGYDDPRGVDGAVPRHT